MMNPLQAIKQYCRNCSGDQKPKDCPSTDCILYSWRLGKKPKGSDISSWARTTVKAIRERCLDCTGQEPESVKNCKHPRCPLKPFRMGRNPKRLHSVSATERNILNDRLVKARGLKKCTEKPPF